MAQHIGGKKNKLRSRIEKPLTRDVRAILIPVADQVRGLLRRAARADGTIDPRHDDDLSNEIGNRIQRVYVGANYRSAFDRDGVTALAQYPQLLNEWYVSVVAEAVTVHTRYMKRKLPADVFRWLETQGQFPSLAEASDPYKKRPGESPAAFAERFDALRIFRANPLAQIDESRQWVPMHKWNTPDGYRLSDRIWNTSTRSRSQIDRLVGQGIREGWSAVRIANAVEHYLLPSERALRTTLPYGPLYMPGGASASAMRLARTEISRAANHAAYLAAHQNPYVDKIDVARSRNGDPTCKICPPHATIGINGNRTRPPYRVDNARLPIYHPHCMCAVIPIVSDPASVTRQMRAAHEEAHTINLYQPRVMTPSARMEFIEMMIGQMLMNMVPII